MKNRKDKSEDAINNVTTIFLISLLASLLTLFIDYFYLKVNFLSLIFLLGGISPIILLSLYFLIQKRWIDVPFIWLREKFLKRFDKKPKLKDFWVSFIAIIFALVCFGLAIVFNRLNYSKISSFILNLFYL